MGRRFGELEMIHGNMQHSRPFASCLQFIRVESWPTGIGQDGVALPDSAHPKSYGQL